VTSLFVNVDHVATIREARKTYEPDPLKAALLVEKVGVEGITVHLREDRRHIQDKDVRIIHNNIKTKLNLEMAAIKEMVDLALELKPYQVSLVPEKRQEVTTEGGLDVCSQIPELLNIQKRIKSQGILFSLFVDPDIRQIEASKEVNVDSIEINTGLYSELTDQSKIEEELARIRVAAKQAERLGLRVFAGHGLRYDNVKAISAIPEIEELNIGHFLVAQSVYIGIEEAVRIMKKVIKTSSS
jgi:pyridoxine 5-phosphate synthase